MTSWMKALKGQKLEVRSARDALQVKGWLDTGNYALNWAISGRLQHGYPLGHTNEIFGDPGTGKSFLVARAIAMAQEAGGVALLDDTEGAYSAEHSAKLGINVNELAVVNSHTVKEHLGAARAFLKAFRETRQKGPGVLACDSLAQLSTEHEMEVQLDKRDMSKAAELKTFYRIIGGDLQQLLAIHMATNHTIAAIGSMYQTRTTPGGGGPKFSATIRLDMRTVSKIKRGTDYIGVICTVFVDKNRIAPPWKRVQLSIPFDKPIARHSGLVPLLVELGVLREKGQFLFRGVKKLGRAFGSKERFLDQDETGANVLAAYPELLEETDQLIAEGKLGGLKASAEVEVPPEEKDGDA